MVTRADSKFCFVILERSSPSEEIKGTLSFTFIRYFATFPSPPKKTNSNILAIYSKSTLYNKLIKQMNTFRENSRL